MHNDDDRTRVRDNQQQPADTPSAETRFVHQQAATPAAHVQSEVKILNQRFVLEEEISRGGMGIVYKALDLRRQEARDRDDYVAVKVIGEAFLQQYENAFISLQREASKAQKLSHPHIINVYDFDRDKTDNTVYMTMELLEGESLEALLQRRQRVPLPKEQAFAIIRDIGEALSYAHQQNVVHSDIKPANLFITRNGQVKVLDFGIATALYQSSEEASATLFNPRQLGALTTAYAPIEMFSTNSPDPRDDVYAFAVVCYEILSGDHPFNKRSTLESMHQGLQPKPIKGLTRHQWQALKKGLAFQREQRTATIAELVDGLHPAATTRLPTKRLALFSTAAILMTAASITLYTITHDPLMPETKKTPPPTLPEPPIVTPKPPAEPPDINSPTEAPKPTSILALTAAQPQYTAGDKLWFYATVAEDSYLSCYYNDNNTIIRIFPNRFQRNALITPGDRIEIPDMNSQQGFDITLDKGDITETILCLATKDDPGSRLPPALWGTDLEPLPFSTLSEITAAFNQLLPSSSLLSIPVKARSLTVKDPASAPKEITTASRPGTQPK